MLFVEWDVHYLTTRDMCITVQIVGVQWTQCNAHKVQLSSVQPLTVSGEWQLPREMHIRLILSIIDVWAYQKAVSNQNATTMTGMMRKDGQPSNHTFRLLSKHDLSPCSATLRKCQTKQMKKILTPSPWRTGGNHWDVLVLHGWKTIQQDLKSNNPPRMKQLSWLRIVHSGDWCLRLALYSDS